MRPSIFLLSMFFLLPAAYAQDFKNDPECGVVDSDELLPVLPLFLKKNQLLQRFDLQAMKRVRKLDVNGDSALMISNNSLEQPVLSWRYAHAIPLVFHLVLKADGSGGIPRQDFYTAIDKLNENFRSINFRFEICEIREIKSDHLFAETYYSYLDGKPPAEAPDNAPYKLLNVTERNVAGVINIYTLPSSDKPKASANWARFPRKKAWRQHVVMRYGSILGKGNTVLTHELGHWFGLKHTFSKDELVKRDAGRNCESAGDGFCDTPADPKHDPDVTGDPVDDDCNYILSDQDEHGHTYRPDTRNFMSYYGKCRNRFSLQQQRKILRTYLLLDEFRGYQLVPCMKANFYPNAGTYPSPFRFEIGINVMEDKAKKMEITHLKTWYTIDLPGDAGSPARRLAEPDAFGRQEVTLRNSSVIDKNFEINTRTYYDMPDGAHHGRLIDTDSINYTVYRRSPGPANLRASSNSPAYIRLTWNALSNVSKYVLYLQTSIGPFKFAEVTDTTYDDTQDAGSNASIDYVVRAIFQNNRESELSNTARGRFLMYPLAFTVTRDSANVVQIDWEMPSFGANLHLEFIIYRSATNDFTTASEIGRYSLQYRYVGFLGRSVALPNGYIQRIQDSTAGAGSNYWYWVVCRDKTRPENSTPVDVGKQAQ